MLIITESQIEEYTRNMFSDDGKIIRGKHDPYKGEREFALSMIEQSIGLLERGKINDEFLTQYIQGLISLANDESKEYNEFLGLFSLSEEVTRKSLEGEKLSREDRRILAELMKSNLGEYLFKGNYQSCCYSAMKAFLITAYCIIIEKISFPVGSIDMIADLDDELKNIKIFEADKAQEHIFLQWHSSNKINSIYMIYKYQYVGLDDSSILDLVAADVIEEDYYLSDERFSIAPSILVKQYCSIIEHEVNQIIQLLNLKDKPDKHLMWYDMKMYVKKHKINLETTGFSLSTLLSDLHGLRNKASHGEMISKEEYEVIIKYKNEGLFNGLSAKKLVVNGKEVHPTIDEIEKYL